MNDFNTLQAISPVDGRYRSKTSSLEVYFSEFALIRYRVKVEVLYFIALCDAIPNLTGVDRQLFAALHEIVDQFSLEDAEEIKRIEKTTNHDVKAVEYFLKDKFSSMGLGEHQEFIHFGLTSQDINNTAIPMSLQDAMKIDFLPELENVISQVEAKSEEWKNIPMLAKTHGQPASPTRLGKEFSVFVQRLRVQVEQIQQIPYSGKFGGATGNFNAHYLAFPEVDWHTFGHQFLREHLKISRSEPTTQIEHYDNLAALFDGLKRINTVLIDLCRDIWTYISMNYFSQKIVAGEIGSSAMPHKVNPIDFENAEGNLGIANAIFEHLSGKLPISRLQRDLTDSTVLRNIGVPVAHTHIALQSILKGLGKLQCNEHIIKADLEDNWAVVAEGIQTILRREGFPKPYEALKDLTRKNERITADSIHQFIERLDVGPEIKEELLSITPFNYVGK